MLVNTVYEKFVYYVGIDHFPCTYYFRIVLNWPNWFTEFNFTSASFYWIIISYELRYAVLRIYVWENPCIENIPEAVFQRQECSL